MKPDEVSIVSITNSNTTIFGLGDDQMIYRWDAGQHVWRSYA